MLAALPGIVTSPVTIAIAKKAAVHFGIVFSTTVVTDTLGRGFKRRHAAKRAKRDDIVTQPEANETVEVIAARRAAKEYLEHLRRTTGDTSLDATIKHINVEIAQERQKLNTFVSNEIKATAQPFGQRFSAEVKATGKDAKGALREAVRPSSLAFMSIYAVSSAASSLRTEDFVEVFFPEDAVKAVRVQTIVEDFAGATTWALWGALAFKVGVSVNSRKSLKFWVKSSGGKNDEDTREIIHNSVFKELANELLLKSSIDIDQLSQRTRKVSQYGYEWTCDLIQKEIYVDPETVREALLITVADDQIEDGTFVPIAHINAFLAGVRKALCELDPVVTKASVPQDEVAA